MAKKVFLCLTTSPYRGIRGNSLNLTDERCRPIISNGYYLRRVVTMKGFTGRNTKQRTAIPGIKGLVPSRPAVGWFREQARGFSLAAHPSLDGEVERTFGYGMVRHSIEFFGFCPECGEGA